MNQVETELTSDGYVAARAGEMIYIMLPARNDFRIARRYGKQDISTLTEAHFSGHGGNVANEDEFKAYVGEIREHLRQKEELGRVRSSANTRTPWGAAQSKVVYADGIISYETASHGGFKVHARYNREIPAPYRNENGWYEEDCEWAKVAVSFPAFFTEREVRLAKDTVRNWFPDEYEAVTGEIIPEGESLKKDERIFKERNADNWVVTSARSVERGMVHCWATKGGERSEYVNGAFTEVETAEFLVPADEYQTRSLYGFVIDPDRHERLDAPAMKLG